VAEAAMAVQTQVAVVAEQTQELTVLVVLAL
jgi:hypothetical protein